MSEVGLGEIEICYDLFDKREQVAVRSLEHDVYEVAVEGDRAQGLDGFWVTKELHLTFGSTTTLRRSWCICGLFYVSPWSHS